MKHLLLQKDYGRAKIVFDRPGSSANTFDAEVLQEFIDALNQLRSDPSVESLVITSAKPSIFIAGADIKTLSSATPGELAALIDLGHEAFNILENLDFPTVALIHGACAGGGYELALACDWRIASDDASTKIGLPETQLGILPAWGGSTRLPRLLGLTEAIPIVLGGKLHSAQAAKRKGLVDEMVHRNHMETFANRFIHSGKRELTAHPLQHNAAAARVIEAAAHKKLIEKTRGLYPAPEKALEVMCYSVYHDEANSFRKERDAIIELVSQPETTQLINLFLQREKARKLSLPHVSTKRLQHPAVIGSGIMGSGITYWLSARGFDVLMQDIDDDAVARGLTHIDRQYADAVKHHVMDDHAAHAGLDRIHASAERLPLTNHDLIIEAAVENLEVKKQIFADLSERSHEDCILATNTSALPIHELSKVIRNPSRLVGLHFFNPVARMQLIEVVKAPSTSESTLASAIRFVQSIGKLPVVVKDSPGFLVNRILVPYLLEACHHFAEGVAPEAIDEAMLAFGMPMGPLRLLDEVGLDVGKHVADTLVEAYPDRMHIPVVLKGMLDAGFLGRKVGQGFYCYDESPPQPNAKALALCDTEHGEAPEHLTETLANMLSDEAARCLEEGIAESAAVIDFAMVMGTGYPPFRGGPLQYAQSQKHHAYS